MPEKNTQTNDEFQALLEQDSFTPPKVGDIVTGTVLSASNAEVKLDIGGIMVGIVRGRELYREAPEYANLKTGDTIEQVAVKAEERREATTEPSLVLEPTVLYEDADFLVLEKPSGLLVHPTEKNEPHTVSGWLQQRYPEIVTVGEHSYSPRLRSGEAGRAGIVHRLDREVSGVMLAARSQQAFNSLKEQFKQRMVKKEYTTICYGHLPNQKDELSCLLAGIVMANLSPTRGDTAKNLTPMTKLLSPTTKC